MLEQIIVFVIASVILAGAIRTGDMIGVVFGCAMALAVVFLYFNQKEAKGGR